MLISISLDTFSLGDEDGTYSSKPPFIALISSDILKSIVLGGPECGSGTKIEASIHEAQSSLSRLKGLSGPEWNMSSPELRLSRRYFW
jgi:hypothetical protein